MKKQLETVIIEQDIKGLETHVKNGLNISEIKLVDVFKTIYNSYDKENIEGKLKTEFIMMFIENGVDIEYKVYSKSEIKIYGYSTGECKLNKILLSCFQFSILFYDRKLIKYFVEKGVDINQELVAQRLGMANSLLFQSFPLEAAYHHNDIELIQYLIDNGAKINGSFDVDYEQYETNKLLLESGVHPDKFTYDIGRTVLEGLVSDFSFAEEQAEPYKAEILSDAINNKNVSDSSIEAYGNIVKHVLESQQRIDAIKLFIEHGADVNTGCPINNILTSDYFNGIETLELFNLFMNAGLDVNCKDRDGNTPLIMIAILNKAFLLGTFEDTIAHTIISGLIKNGAHINATNKMGMTALMLASYNRQEEIVKLLLEHGADINVKSEITAFDLTADDKIKELINDTRNHTPQKLVKILTNFTLDKPIKFTTHGWDFDLKKEYKDFDRYMLELKKQFNSIKDELKELSPNLHDKIYTFLMEANPKNDYSWCSKAKINIGWSSLEGLKEHCNSGKKPCEFELPESLSKSIELPTGAEVTTFGEVIELFKQEIEIRRDSKNMWKIFRKIGTRLGKSGFILSTQKIDRQFYTDVEKFTVTLDKIFDGIKKHSDYKNIEVEANEFDDGTIELKITQINSLSTLNAKDLFEQAEDGDFADIKANLTNLCDWSVEGSFEDASFRINYLKSNNVKDIVKLDSKPAGFTHILRFYKR